MEMLEFGSGFKRSEFCSSELFVVKEDTAASRPFYGGTTIELVQAEQMLRSKKNEQDFCCYSTL